MNHVSVSPTDGNGPTQGQRKTLTRVGIEPTTFTLHPIQLTHLNINESSFFARFLSLDAASRPYYINYSSYRVNAFRVQVENGLENVFFLHFSLISIQFDMS